MATATNEAVQLQQYLTFLLMGEEYAISIFKVREIIEYDTVTIVPKTPKWIRGVINLRGRVVPVVDLAVKFGLEERPVTRTSCIVIVDGHFENQNTTMGIMADAVSQVLDLAKDDIREVPEFGTRAQMNYLLGMAQVGKRFALLLDVDKVLSTNELLGLAEIAATAGTAEAEPWETASAEETASAVESSSFSSSSDEPEMLGAKS
jgi:purine-binding chemotaxis protein CheW